MAGKYSTQRDFGQEMCPHHQKPLIMECLTCPNTLVCHLCVVQSHNGHKFKDIKESARVKREKISNFVQTTENETMPEVKRRIQDTGVRIENNTKASQLVVNQLQEQAVKLKKLIDENLQKSIDLVQSVTKENESLLQKYKGDLENTLKDMTKTIQEYKKVNKSDKDILVFDTANRISKFVILNLPSLARNIFTPSTDPNKHLEKAMGMMKEVNHADRPMMQRQFTRNPSFSIQARVLSNTPRRKSFLKMLEYLERPKVIQDLALPGVPWSIHSSKENLMWVFLRKQNEMQLLVGDSMTNRIKPDVHISGVYVSPSSGEVIGFCEKDDSVRKIDPKTGATTVLFSSFNITCLAIMNNNQILVGTIDPEENGGRLFLYTRGGKRIGHNDLVPVPLQLAVSKQRDIIAVTTEKKVLVMDNLVKNILYVYITDQESGIHTAIFDHQGDLLVEDEPRGVIHIVDVESGWKKHSIMHSKIGLVWTMGVNHTGHLWIGSKEDRTIHLLAYTK